MLFTITKFAIEATVYVAYHTSNFVWYLVKGKEKSEIEKSLEKLEQTHHDILHRLDELQKKSEINTQASVECDIPVTPTGRTISIDNILEATSVQTTT